MPHQRARWRLAIAHHLILLSLLVLLPQVVLGTIIAWRYSADQRAAVEAEARVEAREHRADLDRELRVMIAMLQALASSRSLVTHDVEGFRQQMQDLLTSRGIAMNLRDISGRRIIGVSAPNVGDFAENPQVASLDRKVIDTAAAQVSNLLEDPASGRPYLVVAVPVVAGGKVSHVLDMVLEPANILNLVLRDVPAGWLASVADNDFRVITRSREPDRYVGRRGPEEVTRNLGAAEGTFYGGLSLDGEKVFLAYQRSAVSGWTVLFAVPVAVLDRPLDTLVRMLVLIGAVGVATSLIVATVYSRVLSRAISGLAKSAATVGREPFQQAEASRVREVDDVNAVLQQTDAELKRASSKQATLLAELDHRVKNTLAIIQSLVSQTFRSAQGPQEFQRAITGRVMALSRSHEVLSMANWESPELQQVAEAVLLRESRQVDIEGPRVLLRPKAVVALSQAFHELLSNATQHGSLTSASGRVSVSWRVEGDADQLVLVWRETRLEGKPKPPQAGLGQTIVRICIERQLGGTCEFNMAEEGLVFSARIPMESELGRNATLAG